ncbi:MAG: hypothetical protein HZA91_00395 [Verrucomicrobia bacterium]|nr:hypothetical protein [Verrucomicrobiota bacterium]
MKKLRIYVDTSVLGGCFDTEFAPWSNGLMEDFRRGVFVPVLSDVTGAEIGAAPEQVRDVHAELVGLGAEMVSVNEESLSLLSSYESHAILGARFRNDLLHIALATIAEVDVLVSWNFRHIVRLDKIRLFNAVNLESGYKTLQISSPREVTSYDSEDNDKGR